MSKAAAHLFLVILSLNFISGCAPYAFKDAYAQYRMEYETSLASFKASIEYRIVEVWCSNSTMIVDINIEGSAPFVQPGRRKDDIRDPEYFPALSPSERGKEEIKFGNVEFRLARVDRTNCEAGSFDVYVYRSKEGVGEIHIDTNTGLLIKGTGLLIKGYFEEGVYPFRAVLRIELRETNIYGTNFLIILFIVFAIVGALVAIFIVISMKKKSRVSRPGSYYSPESQQTEVSSEDLIPPSRP